MKVLAIVAGAAALIAWTPAAYASPPAVLCAACPSDVAFGGGLAGCAPETVPLFVAFSDGDALGLSAEDCDSEGLPLGDAFPVENRPDGAPPEDTSSAGDLDGPTQADPHGLVRSGPGGARATNTPVEPPARPGGDPTSIVQRPHAPEGTERGSVDNRGDAMRGEGLPREVSPGVPASPHGPSGVSPPERRPVLPPIVPGPSGPASAGSKVPTLAPTETLRAGRKSWAAMVGAAVVAEAGLLWLAVGFAIRRRRVSDEPDAGAGRRSER